MGEGGWGFLVIVATGDGLLSLCHSSIHPFSKPSHTVQVRGACREREGCEGAGQGRARRKEGKGKGRGKGKRADRG